MLFACCVQVVKLRSELEQQRLDLEKQHSTEMEEMLEKVYIIVFFFIIIMHQSVKLTGAI